MWGRARCGARRAGHGRRREGGPRDVRPQGSIAAAYIECVWSIRVRDVDLRVAAQRHVRRQSLEVCEALVGERLHEVGVVIEERAQRQMFAREGDRVIVERPVRVCQIYTRPLQVAHHCLAKALDIDLPVRAAAQLRHVGNNFKPKPEPMDGLDGARMLHGNLNIIAVATLEGCLDHTHIDGLDRLCAPLFCRLGRRHQPIRGRRVTCTCAGPGLVSSHLIPCVPLTPWLLDTTAKLRDYRGTRTRGRSASSGCCVACWDPQRSACLRREQHKRRAAVPDSATWPVLRHHVGHRAQGRAPATHMYPVIAHPKSP